MNTVRTVRVRWSDHLNTCSGFGPGTRYRYQIPVTRYPGTRYQVLRASEKHLRNLEGPIHTPAYLNGRLPYGNDRLIQNRSVDSVELFWKFWICQFPNFEKATIWGASLLRTTVCRLPGRGLFCFCLDGTFALKHVFCRFLGKNTLKWYKNQ